LSHLSEVLRRFRRVEAQLVAHIGEVDVRKLYRHEACSSMFTYCTQILQLSEAESYQRISAARSAQTVRAMAPLKAARRAPKRKG
jgi:hypothetical protein